MILTSRNTQRNSALDFTKGALVLIMVLYHWLNYFWGPHDNRYLRFLTPSFIFISGFIISNVYFSKYGVSDPQLPKRLIQRGLKILGVFALLNVTRNFLMRGGAQDQVAPAESLGKRFIDIYLIGNGVGGGQAKAVAFFILVPISYLLILSALLLLLARVYRYTFHIACLLFLLCAVVSNIVGVEVPSLELLAIGLLGVIAGYAPIEKVNAAVRHPVLLAAAYITYLGAISIWNVSYPLQVLGVYLSLMIIYLLGQHDGEPNNFRGTVVLLGKYSLLGYISQIAILQILRVIFNHVESENTVLGLSFVSAFVLTILSIELVDRARSQSKTVDRLYRAVFA
jgi:hypothetical protein